MMAILKSWKFSAAMVPACLIIGVYEESYVLAFEAVLGWTLLALNEYSSQHPELP